MPTIYIRKWTGGRGFVLITAHLSPKDAGTFRAESRKKRFTSKPGALLKMEIPKDTYSRLIEKMGTELGIKITLPLSL